LVVATSPISKRPLPRMATKKERYRVQLTRLV